MEPFVSAFLFAAALAFGAILIVSIARFVSRRDIIRLSGSPLIHSVSRFILAPVALILWGVVLVVLFSFTIGLEGGLLLSVAIIGAARICAYYSEDVAFELARVMPIALIGASFIVSSAVPWAGITWLGGIALIIGLEWILRIGSELIERFEPPHL